MMKRGVVLVAFLMFLLPAPAHAAAPDLKNPQLAVKIDPALSKGEDDYKQALKALSAPQRQKLADLDQSVLMADQPQYDLTAKSVELAACAKLDPTLQMTYGKKIQNFSMTKLDEMREGWVLFALQKKKIDFIDRGLLDKHIAFNRAAGNQAMIGMSNIIAQQIVDTKNKVKCDELKADLDSKYKDDYTVPAKQKPVDVTILRDKNNHTIEACVTGVNHQMDDGTYMDVALVYAHYPNESAPTLQLNAKVMGKDKKYMKVQDAWANFGAIDTRFAAQTMQPSPELLVGRMQPDLILPALEYMKNKKIVAGVKAEGWPKQVAFEAEQFPAKVASRMATCAATINPALAGPLKKVGFALSPEDLQ